MSGPADAFRFRGDADLRLLRDELYNGSWELMLQDLQRRLERRPSVYKITSNIKEDIATIQRMMAEEEASEPGSKANHTDSSTATRDRGHRSGP